MPRVARLEAVTEVDVQDLARVAVERACVFFTQECVLFTNSFNVKSVANHRNSNFPYIKISIAAIE